MQMNKIARKLYEDF